MVKACHRAAGWLLAIVVIAVCGSALCAALAAGQVFDDAATQTPYSIADRLPIHVVQAASPGWDVLLAVWVTLAGIAFAGQRLVVALADLPRRRTPALIGAFLTASAALSAFAIVESSDVYFYGIYGRLYGVYGVNPYLLNAKLPLTDDPHLAQLLPFTGNPPFADPYGPLWTLIAGLQSRLLAGASLWWSAWSFRAVAVAAAAAALGALLYALRTSRPADRVRAAGRFAFHPLVLYETAVGGHNDALMLAPAAWAFAVVDELPLVAGLLLGAAIAVKYVAAIALPFLAVRARRGGIAAAIVTTVLALIVPVLCAHPFQAGTTGSHALASNGSRFAMSLDWLVNMPIFAGGLGNVPAVHWLPSLPVVGTLSWARIVQLVGAAVAALLVAFGAAATLRRPGWKHLWRSVTALLAALPSMHPWYALWLMPAAACGGRWSTFAWWFGVFVLGCYTVDTVAARALPAWVPIVATILYLVAPALIARFAQPAPRAQTEHDP